MSRLKKLTTLAKTWSERDALWKIVVIPILIILADTR